MLHFLLVIRSSTWMLDMVEMLKWIMFLMLTWLCICMWLYPWQNEWLYAWCNSCMQWKFLNSEFSLSSMFTKPSQVPYIFKSILCNRVQYIFKSTLHVWVQCIFKFRFYDRCAMYLSKVRIVRPSTTYLFKNLYCMTEYSVFSNQHILLNTTFWS